MSLSSLYEKGIKQNQSKPMETTWSSLLLFRLDLLCVKIHNLIYNQINKFFVHMSFFNSWLLLY